jgi:hypothetical protein
MSETNVKLGRFMTAYPVSNGRREPWAIKDSDGHYIAYLEWYAPWRQYVMNAEPTAVFSHDCLSAIAGFCKKLTGSKKDSTRLTAEPVNSVSCNDGELHGKREQS